MKKEKEDQKRLDSLQKKFSLLHEELWSRFDFLLSNNALNPRSKIVKKYRATLLEYEEYNIDNLIKKNFIFQELIRQINIKVKDVCSHQAFVVDGDTASLFLETELDREIQNNEQHQELYDP